MKWKWKERSVRPINKEYKLQAADPRRERLYVPLHVAAMYFYKPQLASCHAPASAHLFHSGGSQRLFSRTHQTRRPLSQREMWFSPGHCCCFRPPLLLVLHHHHPLIFSPSLLTLLHLNSFTSLHCRLWDHRGWDHWTSDGNQRRAREAPWQGWTERTCRYGISNLAEVLSFFYSVNVHF